MFLLKFSKNEFLQGVPKLITQELFGKRQEILLLYSTQISSLETTLAFELGETI